MSVEVQLAPPAFVGPLRFTDLNGKRPQGESGRPKSTIFQARNTHHRKDVVRMSRTAAPSTGSGSFTLRQTVSATATTLLDPTSLHTKEDISDIALLGETQRLDNRVLKEKSNLRKNASLGHRRKPSRATLRSSGVTFAEDTSDQLSDGNNNNDSEKPKIPHKQSVLVLPKVPIGGIKLNSVKDRILKQNAKLTSADSVAGPTTQHPFFKNLNLRSAVTETSRSERTTLSTADAAKHEEEPKRPKPTRVSITAPRTNGSADSVKQVEDLVVALLNARNKKLSHITAPEVCDKMAATADGRWRSVTKLTKHTENHVLVVEEEEDEVFFRSSERQEEEQAAGNVRVFHEQFMDDEEQVEEDFGEGLVRTEVRKDYSSSLSSSQITVNGELCSQNTAEHDGNINSKLRSLLRNSGLDTSWEKTQTEMVETVEMSDREELSPPQLSPITVIKDEQTSLQQPVPEVTVNGGKRNGLHFVEDKFSARTNIDWENLEKTHCSTDVQDVNWLQKVQLRNVLEEADRNDRISIPVAMSSPRSNGSDNNDRKWMDPILRLQQSGAVDWDSLDKKKSVSSFDKAVHNADKKMSSDSAPRVNLRHVRHLEVGLFEKTSSEDKEKFEVPAIRVHLKHVEVPTAKPKPEEVRTSCRSPDQVMLIKNTYNAHEWRQLEHEIETKRRPKVERPSPDWVREAEEKRRSFHEWAPALESKQLRPCLDITDDDHKDELNTTNHWVNSSKQHHQEKTNGHWSKEDGHSIRVHVADRTPTPEMNKFDVEGYVKGLVRMRKSAPSKARPQSSPDLVKEIQVTPEWLPIAERKLRNSFDWDSLERIKKGSASKPDVSKMDFEDDEAASESDSSAFSWYGENKSPKTPESTKKPHEPEWVKPSVQKKDVDWENLEGQLMMTEDKNWSKGFRLEEVDLRPVHAESFGSGINSPSNPEWVDIAESKRKSDIDWQALDSETVATEASEAAWTKAVSLRHVEDVDRVEAKVLWSKSDDSSSSCSGCLEEQDGVIRVREGKVDRRIEKFDPSAAPNVIRRKMNTEARTRNISETSCEANAPDWMQLVQYKQTVAVDWDQLESDLEKKGESPTMPEVTLRKVPPKPTDESENDGHVVWLEMANKKRNSGVDWDKLDAEKSATLSADAVWVQGVSLKPAVTTVQVEEDHEEVPFETVSLRHVHPPEEDSTRDFSSGPLWDERPTTPNVDRWQARYKEMFGDLSGESSPPEDLPRHYGHEAQILDDRELRHGITWSRLLEDKEPETVAQTEKTEIPCSEYRISRQICRPDTEYRPNPTPSWADNLKKPSPPTTLNLPKQTLEDQTWLSQTRLRSVSSRTSINEEDASPSTPDWLSKVEKRRSASIDWDTIIKSKDEETVSNGSRDGLWLKDVNLRDTEQVQPVKVMRRESEISTEFKSLIKSPDVDARKILEDLPKRRRGTVRPKEPEVLTGRDALMADIKGGKIKLKTTSTSSTFSVSSDLSPTAIRAKPVEGPRPPPVAPQAPAHPPAPVAPQAPAPPPAPSIITTNTCAPQPSKQPFSFASVLDQIKNSGRDGLLATLRRAKNEDRSVEDEPENPSEPLEPPEATPEVTEQEEKGAFQVTSSEGGSFSVVIDDKDDADFLTKKPDGSIYAKSLSDKYFRKELESPKKSPKIVSKPLSTSPPRVLSTLSKSQSLKSSHTSDTAVSATSKSRFLSDPIERKTVSRSSNVRKDAQGSNDNVVGSRTRSSSKQIVGSVSTPSSQKPGSTSPTSISISKPISPSKSLSPSSPCRSPTPASPQSTSPSFTSFISPTATSIYSTSTSFFSPTSTSLSSTSSNSQSFKVTDKESLSSVRLLQEVITRNASNPDLPTSTSPLPFFPSFKKDTSTSSRMQSFNTSDPQLSSPTSISPVQRQPGSESSPTTTAPRDLLDLLSCSLTRLSVSDTDLAESTGHLTRRSNIRKSVTFEIDEPTETSDSCTLEDAEVAKITRRDVTDPKSWMSATASSASKSRVSPATLEAKNSSTRVSLSTKALASKSVKMASTAGRVKAPLANKAKTDRPISPRKDPKLGTTSECVPSSRGVSGSKRIERPSSPKKESGRKKWEIPKPGSPIPVMCLAQEVGVNSEGSSSRRSGEFTQVIEEVSEGPVTESQTTEVTCLPEATRSVTTHTTSGVRYISAKGKTEDSGKDTLLGARGDSTKTISQLETIRGPDAAVVATREVHGTSGQTVSYQRLTSGGQSVRKTTTTVTTVKTRRKLNQ